MKLHDWNEIEEEVLSQTISRKMITGEKGMVARIFLKKGAIVPEHSHENEQFTMVLSGALEFRIEGKTIIARPGQVLEIPSHVVHSAIALEDTDDLDVFVPPRQDWLEGRDAYLRG
ncbi:MAG: cupin domain-containing protein [Acidobacteria bacterium]|nr:cupin domain-containing protein [Acidobacteriota bacterium]